MMNNLTSTVFSSKGNTNKIYKTELSKTYRLAIPIIVGQLGVVLMSTADNVVVGRLLGAVSLGAAGIANSIAFLIASLAVGGFAAIAPMVSKQLAEHNHRSLARLFFNALVVAMIYSLLFTVVGFWMYKNFHILQQKKDIEELGAPFFFLITLSNIPMVFYLAIKQFSDGFSKPKVVMYITIIGLLFNVAGNIIFIDGLFGFPKWGLNGAAYATILSRVLMASLLFLYLRKTKVFEDLFKFSEWKADIKIVKEILRRSIPAGFQTFFEIAAFSFAVVMMGWLSETELAAHQIAINVASTTYMMASGFAYAGSIRVGINWGNKSGSGIIQAGRAAFTLGIGFMAISSVLLLLFGQYVIGLYIDNEAVLNVALPLLMIAAFFQISDGAQSVALGVLRGVADVKVPTYITFVAYWVLALPIGYLLGFIWELHSVGIWYGLLIGLSVSAVLLYVRFKKVSQKLDAKLSEDTSTI